MSGSDVDGWVSGVWCWGLSVLGFLAWDNNDTILGIRIH